MPSTIRKDLVGVVSVHLEGGYEPRLLKAGDEVPEGYTVDDSLVEGDASDAGGETGGDGGEPKRPAKSATKDEWAEYARATGVEVAEDATKDAIIAAVDAAQAS